MIRYIKLKNYKSLEDLEVDFMKTTTIPKNLVLVYGENGVGKSNFATVFYTLHETTRTMSAIERWKKFVNNFNDGIDERKNKYYNNFIEDFKYNFKDIQGVIDNYKTIDSKENMILEYGFKIDNRNAMYKIEMNDFEIVSEKLEYVIKSNVTCCFDINKNNIKINENLFTDKDYYTEFCDLLEKYWGKHSLLSVLSYEIEDKKTDYIKERTSTALYTFLMYIKTMCTRVKYGNKSEFGTMGLQHDMLANLEKGRISIKKEEELNKTEMLLNIFFTNLYSDIKQVYYDKEIKDNKITYKLYLKKLVYNKLIDIDFKLESTGTQNILDILPCLISACEGQTVIIDELDSGIHDVLVESILNSIKDYITGQLLITTHNTMLLETDIAKNNIYVFNVDSLGNKKLIPITDFNGRIHKNLNARKQYLKGMYGGVPFANAIDFDELIETLD